MTLALKTTTICAALFFYTKLISAMATDQFLKPVEEAVPVGFSGGYKSQELSVFSMNNEHGILLIAFNKVYFCCVLEK